MKTSLRLATAAALSGCLTLFALQDARAGTDDFNDGNDTGWTRMDPISQIVGASSAALGNTWTFPGGTAYQLTAGPTPDAQAGPGRLGSVLTGETHTHFVCGVDLLPGWDARPNVAVGVLARIQPGFGPGATSGYGFTYQTNGADVQISRLDNEEAHEVVPPVDVSLDPSQGYRLVLMGTGDYLEGRVYSLADLSTPLVVVFGNDATYAQGHSGLVIYDNGGGQGATATFDNFSVTPLEPPALDVLTSPGEFELQWPVDAVAWTLEMSTTLETDSWMAVPAEEISEFGGRWIHPRVIVGDAQRWFRLRRNLTGLP